MYQRIRTIKQMYIYIRFLQDVTSGKFGIRKAYETVLVLYNRLFVTIIE